MTRNYLIRLDDACPTQDAERWSRIEDLLDSYSIKPMVGIVPDNKDENLKKSTEDKNFWTKAKKWQLKGWSIALHGYDHCYVTKDAGINPMWNRSEFAGLSLNNQCEKISKGYSLLKSKGLNPQFFFAPSHTFDDNTLEALRQESDIRIISDTIGRYPYKKGDFWIIPQIAGHCIQMPFCGIFTFCFHPNTMSDAAFGELERFIKENKRHFIGFDDIDLLSFGKKKWIDHFISWAFFNYRYVRGLR